MHPIHIPVHTHEIQLSTTSMTVAAESGEVGRDLGYLPARTLQPPVAMIGSGWSRFLDAGPGQRQPQASTASRPYPRPPRSAA